LYESVNPPLDAANLYYNEPLYFLTNLV